MNAHRIKALIKKELLEMMYDKSTLYPMLFIAVFFSVILPNILIIFSTKVDLVNLPSEFEKSIHQLNTLNLPVHASPEHILIYIVLMYFLMPLFLLMPVIISNASASYSFVGEKEHKTLEGLLYTPLSDKEMLLGKVIASFIPSIVITYGAIVLYGITVNLFGWKQFHQLIFPNGAWLSLILLIIPSMTFLSICLVMMVANKAKSMKSAQSVALFLVVPIIGLIISQASGIMLLGYQTILIAGFVLIILDIIIFLLLVKSFNRDKMVSKL